MESMMIAPKTRIEKKTILVPGDKSVSHRAAMLAALSDGESRIENYLASGDCISTLLCLRRLGADWTLHGTALHMSGVGLHGLKPPRETLDAGNSGTTVRLLGGILAGQPFLSCVDGDASLRNRPMNRIIDPLAQMGARIESAGGKGFLPLAISGGGLHGIAYEMPVASAQVKSSILLAGLFAEGPTTVIEKVPTRDHTERFFAYTGIPITCENGRITVSSPEHIRPISLTVPGDISSAAYFLALGSLLPDSELTISCVGVNPSRRGIIDVLRRMGADIKEQNERLSGGEPVADLTVRSSQLHGIEIGGDIIANIIDELPLLAVAACFAKGVTTVHDARELRVKESDRIEAMTAAITAAGGDITAYDDGFAVNEKPLNGGRIVTCGDHRVAMSMAIAGALSQKGVELDDTDCIAISFPGFCSLLSAL